VRPALGPAQALRALAASPPAAHSDLGGPAGWYAGCSLDGKNADLEDTMRPGLTPADHARLHRREVQILETLVGLGLVMLIITTTAVLFTDLSALAMGVLGVGAMASFIAPGWALLTLHDPPAEEPAEVVATVAAADQPAVAAATFPRAASAGSHA
jgi:hypothetical protein